MSQSGRPKRSCRSRSASSSQPTVSSTSLQRQAQARERARADARTNFTNEIFPHGTGALTSTATFQNERVVSTQPTPVISLSPEVVEDPPQTLSCPICTIDVADDTHGLLCESCFCWYHAQCLFISDAEYTTIKY